MDTGAAPSRDRDGRGFVIFPLVDPQAGGWPDLEVVEELKKLGVLLVDAENLVRVSNSRFGKPDGGVVPPKA